MDDSRHTSAPPARGPCDRDGTRGTSRGRSWAYPRAPSGTSCTARAVRPHAVPAAARPHGNSYTAEATARRSDHARDDRLYSRRRLGRARSSACRCGRSRSSASSWDRAEHGSPRTARVPRAPSMPRPRDSSRRTPPLPSVSARARGDMRCTRRGPTYVRSARGPGDSSRTWQRRASACLRARCGTRDTGRSRGARWCGTSRSQPPSHRRRARASAAGGSRCNRPWDG